MPKGPTSRSWPDRRIALDERFASVLVPAPPLSSAGPFASAAVPEGLEALHAQELRAIGRPSVPKRLDRVHAGLAQILSQEDRRREKFAQSKWSWDAPKFESAFHRRRLRILNAVFRTLSRRGHRADAYERDGEIHATATIGDTRVGLAIDRAARARGSRGSMGTVPDWPASTPLAFLLDASFEGKDTTSWQDDSTGQLETSIAEMTARIIVAGEAKFRRSLAENEKRAEQFSLLEEQRRQEEIEQRNRERLERLRTSGELLRRAVDLRSLIGRVRDAVCAGSVDVDEATLHAWEEWASAEADRLDPILSGQIMSHLSQRDETC
jgi:hypothetical protein